jgi:hypothetical protein
LINPNRFLSVKSAVPGCALKLSAAPPTTIVIALPGPDRSMFEHDFFDTEQIPSASKMSLYMGNWKFDVSVRRCGWMPGKVCENPVAANGS